MLLLILCILIIILCGIVVKYTSNTIERFQTDLTINIVDNNCLDYIDKELYWDIEYDIDRHLPQTPVDPEYIKSEKAKLIEARKDILKDFDSVKYKIYSNMNSKYTYARACSLSDNRISKNISKNDVCDLKGKNLSYSKNNIDNQYGKRKTDDVVVELKNFNDYIKSNTDINANIFGLKNDVVPNEGCFIDTYDKYIFFDKITKLAKMKIYEAENNLNLEEVNNMKTHEKNKNLNNSMQLYGITPVNDYDTTVLPPKCSIRTTSLTSNGGNQYNYLDKHAIACGDDEILSNIQFQTNNNKMLYKYTCCKPQMKDERIKMKQNNDFKYTKCHLSDKNYQDPWNIDQNIECGENEYINSMQLEIDKCKLKQNNDRYKYKCSVINKEYPKDQRMINESCIEKQTDTVEKNSGTNNMQYLNMDCKGNEGIYLKNIKLINPTENTYAYKYTCCKPLFYLPS